jgi:hypothetical protein
MDVTFGKSGRVIKVLSTPIHLSNISSSLHTSHHILHLHESNTTAKMGAEADTDKPHSHHAIPKDIPEDKGLKNEAAPGVCTPLSIHHFDD